MTPIPIGKLCTITMGQAPEGDTYNSDGNGLPLIAGAGDFGSIYPKSSRFTNAPTKIAEEKDIIICVRATIGDLNWADRRYCLGRGVASIRPKNGRCLPSFVWWALHHNTEALRLKGRGATFKQISKADIEDLEIPALSLDEQHRLAAILDQADDLRRKRRMTLEWLEKFSSALFKQISRSTTVDMVGLGDICRFVAGSSLPESNNDADTASGTLLLKVSDLSLPANELLLIASKARVATIPRSHSSMVAREGSVVFPKRGGAIATNRKRKLGRSAILDPNLMAVASTDSDILNPDYLYAWICDLDLTSISNGSTVPQLNKADLNGLSIALPSIDQQRTFAASIVEVERLKVSHRAQLAKLDALFASLQHRAFRGEL